MTDQEIQDLGPLGVLVGKWQGEKGRDLAPGADRGTDENLYREEMSFDPTGRVDNHEQVLYGLRYRTTAWRIGHDEPFHEELGYWLWDAKEKQVLRCFMVPRGVTVLAGGEAQADAKSFELSAKAGSDTYGICSNLFLDKEFKTVRYDLKITVHDSNSFTYEEDTQLQMKGRDQVFHHTDQNTLTRVQ